jgi:pyruvate dehydrogenase E2 component (dihydrolipoamide acetyltransferase)
MARLVEVPALSPTMTEGDLAAWHKKEGDLVAQGELLAEIETDKALMELQSPAAGMLLKVLVSQGAKVKVGQPIAIFGAAGEDVSALAARFPPVVIGTPRVRGVPDADLVAALGGGRCKYCHSLAQGVVCARCGAPL